MAGGLVGWSGGSRHRNARPRLRATRSTGHLYTMFQFGRSRLFGGCAGSLWLEDSSLWLSLVTVCGFSCVDLSSLIRD